MTVWVLASFVSAALCAAAIATVLQRRTVLTKAIVEGLSTAALWAVAGGVLQLVSSPTAARLLVDVVVIAGAGAIVAAQAYAAALSGHGPLLGHRRARLLLVEPFLIALAAATDPWHHLVVTEIDVDPVRMVVGPVLWVHVGYALLTMVVVGVVHLQSAWSALDRRWSRHVASAVAVLVPALALAVSIANAEEHLVDYAGALVGVTAAVWVWVERSDQGPRGLPISTAQTLQALPDAIVVSDPRGRIVGANTAARELLTAEVAGSRQLIGSRWDEIVRPDLLARLSATSHQVLSVSGGRTIDVRITRLHQPDGSHQGTVTVIRDISEIERLRAELAEQTVRDGLTGLHNRRHLDRVLTPLVDTARGTGEPLAAVMLDLDHFKDVNDTYGHTVGDEVLVAVARELGRCVRSGDVLVRFGGEEFLVLLPGTTADVGAVRAEECRRRISELDLRTSGPRIRSTLSAGVAVLGPDADADALLRDADDALYAAKAAGRDRVVVAGER